MVHSGGHKTEVVQIAALLTLVLISWAKYAYFSFPVCRKYLKKAFGQITEMKMVPEF